MTVFKNYLKIQKKHLPTILMYVAICVGISILMSVINSGSGSSFLEEEMNVAVINRDHSCISDSLESYIRKQSRVIEIGTTSNEMTDAIFERKVDAIFIIPDQFGQTMMEKKDPQVLIRKVPDSMAGRYVELRYNNYLDLITYYVKAGLPQEDAVRCTEEDLEQLIDVQMVDPKSAVLENLGNYYNFVSYGLMAALIFGTGLSMMAFRRKKVLDRTITSGVTSLSMDVQILAANLVFSMLVFLVFFVCALIIYRKEALTEQGLLMAANAAVFTLCISCIAYFAGMLSGKREAVIGVANIFSLGSAFLCGAFVPQEILGESVLKIGRFLPAYWYVRCNDRLKTMTELQGTDLSFFQKDCLILLAFAFFFLLAAAVAEKMQRR